MRALLAFRWRSFCLTVLLLIGFANVPAFADDAITEGSQNPLQLGRVTVLGPVACPIGATTGATCTSVNVVCPGVPNLTGTLSEASPTGTARGTIILANGGGGTSFFNAGFASAYLNDGFRVAQFLWTTDWEDTWASSGWQMSLWAPAGAPPSSDTFSIPFTARI